MKGWHVLMIVVLAGAIIALWWFRKRQHKAETMSEQASPTHSPQTYTAPALPSITGAPVVKPVKGDEFLNAVSGVVASQAKEVANRLSSQAQKKINSGVTAATKTLTQMFAGWGN